MKNFVSILLCLLFFFSSTNLAAISECTTTSTTSSNQTLAQTEEFGPLQIAIADLESIQGILDEGNKKLAVTIIKSATGQLRKISQLSKVMVKGMTKRLKKAIAAVKRGDNSTALAEVNHVLSELQSL